MIDETHDPALQSWVESANVPGTDFPIQNLPYGTFATPDKKARVGVAVGDQILDLSAAFEIASTLDILRMKKGDRTALRRRISSFLHKETAGARRLLVTASEVRMLLPASAADYTDFYASIDHASNVGSMLRPDNPLLPNYKWLPVAYHGRASSLVVSGTPVQRPWGQMTKAPTGPPEFHPTQRLDYEVELAAWLGPGNARGAPIPVKAAEDHIVGVGLLNDWSARDVQTWEYQPLGPFLAKNFATSVSPWIVTTEALEPFRAASPKRGEGDPTPLPHLRDSGNSAFHITLEVWLRTATMTEPVKLSRSDFASMYWTLAQMVAHHTSNGCALRAGDLIGSGTVSGPNKNNRGCLLELTWRGTEPLELPGGETRGFLEDGDEVTIRGYCQAPGYMRIGLGACTGVISPALQVFAE